jgi:hypothetical protein
MNNKIIGIALLIVGVALMIWGYNAYDSVGSQVTRAFGGNVSIEAVVGLGGGLVCIVLGIIRIK